MNCMVEGGYSICQFLKGPAGLVWCPLPLQIIGTRPSPFFGGVGGRKGREVEI